MTCPVQLASKSKSNAAYRRNCGCWDLPLRVHRSPGCAAQDNPSAQLRGLGGSSREGNRDGTLCVPFVAVVRHRGVYNSFLFARFCTVVYRLC
jgi:hypothetical protein